MALAPLGQRQLSAWQDLAEAWPTELDAGAPPHVWRCGRCGGGIMLATDRHGTRYDWTAEGRRDMIVLHLRTRHEDLDPARDVRLPARRIMLSLKAFARPCGTAGEGFPHVPGAGRPV